MKYFFSSPEGLRKTLQKMGATSYLLSFAVDAKSCHKFDAPENDVIIDSGAFTVWNKGGSIDIDEYINFCKTKPGDWSFINLDVIPKTGSSSKDIELCCEQSFENYLYLRSKLSNVLPVYHYGDNPKWLDKYIDHTDYVGISPANDTHENVKREFLKKCFKVTGKTVKTHGLGYSSLDGMLMFPFYSVDSVSFKKIPVYLGGKKTTFWFNSKMEFLNEQRIKQFLDMERYVTRVWHERGMFW